MASKLLSTTAEVLFPRNRLRRSFAIQNEDATINIFIKQERAETPSVSSTDHDHRITGGNAMSINDNTDGKEAIQDRWTIVAASGTPRVSFFETEDVVR